jgi:glycerophosphoryl diester phosphodiesterase
MILVKTGRLNLKKFSLLFLALAAVAAAGAQNSSQTAVQKDSRPPAPLPAPRHAFTISCHRGDHTHAPENTLKAYENAIKAGADYVEIDLRTTVDSQLVIMHDATVNRMTNGAGLIKDMHYDSLSTLRVKDKTHPEWGEFPIPTFGQVLELCKDKIYIYLDFKNADPGAAYRLIQKYGMEKQVVVYINAEQQFHDWRRVAPAMPLMVSLPGSVKDVESLKHFLDKVHPEILDGDYDQYTQEMITTAQQLGYTVLPDIQGPAEGPALWEQPIQKGIKALQTDHPEDLIAWLVGKSIR